MQELFLQVNKTYLNQGLKPIEILILSQIEEYTRNGCECYVTNKQFAALFGVTEKTVATTLDKLEAALYISRDTAVVSNKGQVTRQRVIKLISTKKPTNKPTVATKNFSGFSF